MGPRASDEEEKGSLWRRTLLLTGVLVPLAVLLFSCTGCSPVYVARAGWTELQILRGRRPIQQVLSDPETSDRTRHQLLLAQQARAYAGHMLGLNTGDSYTTFTRLESDTLAWVLSAAYPDRLESKTWWFPIVGSVPYKGYANKESAEGEQRELEKDRFDTYLRTTSAFSTLGWFSDPLLSSLLRYDDVELVSTIIHELSHNHLFLKGQVRFNESFATFVGRVGAVRFFCGPGDPVANPEECATARARWEDDQAFSVFLDELVTDLQEVYGDPGLSVAEKVQIREETFRNYQERYLGHSGAGAAAGPAVSPRVRRFLERPLNNAVLLSRIRYYHRLPDFQAYLEEFGGDLRAAIASLSEEAPAAEDPFDVLPG